MGGIRLKEFDAWLEEMATHALPGGVAAAARSAAMGAALVAKVTRLTLQRQHLSAVEQQRLVSLVDLASKGVDGLQRLAGEDARAYRQVLETGALPVEGTERRLAWQRATDVPLRVAEVCQELLLALDLLTDRCWPAVGTDLHTARRLLAVGRESGLEAAEANLQSWAEADDARGFGSRMRAIRGERL
jgi:formiminotetrahydrofolate cyclodeaminase